MGLFVAANRSEIVVASFGAGIEAKALPPSVGLFVAAKPTRNSLELFGAAAEWEVWSVGSFAAIG